MNDKEHKEIIKDVIENDDLFREDHRHKVWILFMSLFILSITLTYFLLSVPSFGRFLGLISTEVSDDNVFSYGGQNITIAENILAFLNERYQDQIEHESIYCLEGHVVDGHYIVTKLIEPEVISESYAGVRFKSCADETIIMLHTHPIKDCVASNTDLNTLYSFKERNADILMAVMCEENRISFYG